MIDAIARLLIGTAAGFLTTALLARFLMQAARVPFRNPLGQFVIAVTDWMVVPARRVIPSAWGYDSATLLLAIAWQLVKAIVLLLLAGWSAVSPSLYFAVLLLALANTLEVLLYLIIGVVLVAAVFSWTNPRAPLAQTNDTLTRPWLAPLRRVIPPVGGIDLSPLALIVGIQVVLIMLGGAQGSLLRQIVIG